MSEALTKREEEILRHMLGADARYKKSQWGFRNHFCSRKSGNDYETLMQLNRKGFVLINGQSPAFLPKDDVVFFATEDGCRAIGFTEKQVERTFKK